MSDRPLTTGEGNTARPWQCEGCDYVNVAEARRECDGCGEPKSTALLSRSGALADLSEALAECGRLREHAKEQELLAETRKESRRMYRERAEAAEQLAGRLREQLDAARQALRMAEAHLSLIRYRGEIRNWSDPAMPDLHDVDKTITAARAALGVEGPAAGDGQP